MRVNEKGVKDIGVNDIGLTVNEGIAAPSPPLLSKLLQS